MNFSIDGGGFGLGGIFVVMMLVALGFGIIRYNNLTRPQEDRELSEGHEAERREHEAQHENDVPVAPKD